ncbi:MAG: bifunctional riboflavin kinase/FAD synthetase [Alphaproteobacteria bacterium]|nr:bifunctional riboflavin kinase/FAD synthetase [Alphaproteobacteria bacterium]OJV45285.1 MAG: riboflavin biosynthesis protein RibF [Alphaproteobacteria bacterium 43-37]
MIDVNFYTPFVQTLLPSAIYAIGNFDGVHLGHQAIFTTARNMAKKQGLPFGVITFEPHPRLVLAPSGSRLRLTPFAQKMKMLKNYGVDHICVVPFDQKFSQLDYQEFITKVVIGFCQAKGIVVGEDFRFGRERLGSPESFVSIEPSLPINIIKIQNDGAGAQLSSRRILDSLSDGNINEVQECLGRPYSLAGVVVQGNQRGRTIGFPTANLYVGEFALPKMGVYAVSALVGNSQFHGVANIGIRPTFNQQDVVVEVHIFDFFEDIYGHMIEVQFKAFIRPEMKFAGVNQLVAQIRADCELAKNHLR